ncbi:MAG: phosphodiester glycosidase family protein [Bacillota bacterium]
MVVKIRYFLLLMIFSGNLFSQSFDTLVSKPIAPGVYYKKIKAPATWVVNIIKVDLQNPNIKMETVKAANQVKMFKDDIVLVGGMPTEFLSVMAQSENYDGHFVTGAINGDFFTDLEGRPNNIQIVKNEILQKPTKSAVIGFDKSNKPYLGGVTYKGTLIVKKHGITVKDSSVTIDGINNFRGLDQLWFYNQYIGSEAPDSLPRSGQNRWAPEFAIEPIDPWVVNGEVRCIIRAKKDCCPDRYIRMQKGWAILSQHRNNDDWISAVLNEGDTVRVNLEITPGLDHPSEMLGGSPQIVKDGVKYVAQGYVDEGTVIDPTKAHHSKELHPRTSVGLSKDNRYLYMVTVDGNQPNISVGMTLDQLADLMIKLGAYNALNLDGGPATTMYADDQVVNVPSTGQEIPISNALFVVAKSKDLTAVEDMSITPSDYKLYQNYPNPFNPSTTISYYLKENAKVTIKIVNMLGQVVSEINQGYMSSGLHNVSFDASGLCSGIYVYRLDVSAEGRNFSETRKMTILK